MYDLKFNARIIDTPGIKGFGLYDVKNNELSIRTRAGKDLGVMKVDKFIKMVETLVSDKNILLNN